MGRTGRAPPLPSVVGDETNRIRNAAAAAHHASSRPGPCHVSREGPQPLMLLRVTISISPVPMTSLRAHKGVDCSLPAGFWARCGVAAQDVCGLLAGFCWAEAIVTRTPHPAAARPDRRRGFAVLGNWREAPTAASLRRWARIRWGTGGTVGRCCAHARVHKIERPLLIIPRQVPNSQATGPAFWHGETPTQACNKHWRAPDPALGALARLAWPAQLDRFQLAATALGIPGTK